MVPTWGGPCRAFVGPPNLKARQGCEVAIERLVRTRPTRVVYENDPIPLGWSLLDTDVTHIHARTLRFCDVFVVSAGHFGIGSKAQPNYLADELANSFGGR